MLVFVIYIYEYKKQKNEEMKEERGGRWGGDGGGAVPNQNPLENVKCGSLNLSLQ